MMKIWFEVFAESGLDSGLTKLDVNEI